MKSAVDQARAVAVGCTLLCAVAAHAQTQIKPRVMLMVDTSGSMTEDTVNNSATGGDGSVSYQDQFMSIGANATSPNMSAYRGYSSANTCPPALNTTLGSTSKMAAAKAAVTNVINGSGDIDWGLMRYTGSTVGFPTSFKTTGTGYNINPDPEIWPTANPLPVFCTADSQCPSGQTCDTTSGRCTKQNCTSDAQCTVNPNASGRTCDMTTKQCTCTSNNQCGGNERCVTTGGVSECRGLGGAKCTMNTQCASNVCGANGLCTCSSGNHCGSGSCDGNTAVCRCNNNNQCPGGSSCDTSTGECVVSAATQCPSGQQLGTSNQCKCTADSQCSSNKCDVASGRCLCTANSQCRSNSCDTTVGVCNCNNDNQCWGQATCGGSARCVPGGNSDCPTGAQASGQCSCGAAGPCIRGETCTAGICACGSTADCGANFGNCNAGSCGTPGASCTTENNCNIGEWCVGGVCGYPNTLVSTNNYGMTDTRGSRSCGPHSGLRISYSGTCGTSAVAGASGCNTPQTCFVDGTCGGTTASFTGQCALIGTGPASSCTCTTSANCPTDYTCTSGRCVYNLGCRSAGGQVIVDPTSAGYSPTKILPYADGIEIFTDAGSGVITNPELRGNGSTPLGGSARSATTWYNGIKNAAVGNALYDPKLACRPYILVLLTDGVDTCDDTNGGNRDEGSVAGVQGFVGATVAGAKNVNRVEVIGLSVNTAADQTRLDNMAKAGSANRTTARYANNQTQLEAALADIVASSVLYEQCNGADDNCNNLIDEGLGVYEECVPGSACMVGPTSCDASGRCPCNGTLANQCDAGYACNNPSGAGFCVPTCSVGIGICQRDGVRKCGGSCCVNDGLVACTAVTAGTGTGEVCNNLDDNCNGQIDEGNVCSVCQPTAETCNGKDDDCNGIIDDNLVDTNQPCGSDEGECVAGNTVCQPDAGFTFPHTSDHIVCAGAVGPTAEICDARDNNCDGVTDGMTRACYSGPAATRGVGVCRDGAQSCTATTPGVEAWGACTGEILPTGEICNGIDDDCNGVPDDVSGTGAACCTSGRCGMGTCMAGTTECSGGVVQCVGEVGPAQEICDGIDNDCNGVVDDVPGLGASCTPAGSSCGGTLVCNTTSQMLECVASAAAPEICNGIDDDCDGNVDEAPDVTNNDNRLNQPCDQPVAPANLPPCMAGNTVCQNGQVACVGAVKPEANVCGQPSRDCQTSGIFTGNCPAGFECYEGTCAAPCSMGEFPCPGGFVCQTTQSGDQLCVPDACTKLTCPMGQFCQIDSQGMAVCIDPCMNVSCPSNFRCKEGLCVDDSCRTFGCPEGQVCVGTECKADPCFGKMCDENQYCSPTTGECVRACIGPCPSGEQCVDGLCQSDPCFDKKCAAGETCAVSQGVGVCVGDSCRVAGCNPGAACCGGMCIQDPCAGLACPGGAVCALNSLCTPYCQAEANEKIVGAGGGGFACDYSGSGTRGTPWMFIVVFASLIGISRRRRVR